MCKEVRFEDIKENWKKLMPTLCKAETTKGGTIEHIFSKQWLLKNSIYTQIVANLTDYLVVL